MKKAIIYIFSQIVIGIFVIDIWNVNTVELGELRFIFGWIVCVLSISILGNWFYKR